MGIFTFPGTNYHDLNLDWLLDQMKTCLAEWETVKGQFTSLQEYITHYFDTHMDELYAQLDAKTAEEIQEITAAVNALIETIPEDYSALSGTVENLAEAVGVIPVNVDLTYSPNNTAITNVTTANAGHDISFDIGSTANNIGVYSTGNLFEAGKHYYISFDISCSVPGVVKLQTKFGIVHFTGSGHFSFDYHAAANAANTIYTWGENPLGTISITGFTVYEAANTSAETLMDTLFATDTDVRNLAETSQAAMDLSSLLASDTMELVGINPTSVNEGYSLNAVGAAIPNTACDVKRYAVTAGSVIRIFLADSTSVTKWVFKSSNQGIDTNTVGELHYTTGEIFAKVPSGATYVFLAVPSGDSTSTVQDIRSKRENKYVVAGNIFAFFSGGQLKVRCDTTARLYYNNAAVNCSSWILDEPISDVFLKYICFNSSGFSVVANPNNTYGILGFIYNYTVYPLQKFVIANSIPLPAFYQRSGIPFYVNSRRLDVDLRPSVMSNIVTDYGYFWRYLNAFNRANVLGVYDEQGRAFRSISVTQNTASIANKKILTIGDSITNRGWYQQRILDHVPSVTFVGTKATQNNNLVAEGYSGCRTSQVFGGATIMEGSTPYTNPFWDPAQSKADFAYYAAQTGIDPDIVIIEFGLNETNSNEYYQYISAFIATIKAYRASIAVYVIQMFGPAETLASPNNINFSYRKIVKQCVCESYSFTDCVLIPCYYIIVDEYDYTAGNVAYGYNDVNVPGTTDGIHPSKAVGFAKLGDQVYNYLGL